ncbi:MAG: 8-oxo-dGTP diphosphatase MutT [Eubacteriales bacterium]|jgi:mutator protein MutT
MVEVAAAIIRQQGKVLICQRGEEGNCALQWEFPGGKREEGETPAQCVVREVREELGLDIEVKELYAQLEYHYGARPFHFHFFLCDITGGKLHRDPRVHHDVQWVKGEQLTAYDFCPADLGVCARLAAEEDLA